MPVTCSIKENYALLPPMLVGNVYIIEAPFRKALIASRNFDVTSLLTSCPIFLILGVKNMYEASLMATSMGCRVSNGSSSIKELHLDMF